jgi:hypothetical protein
MVSCDRAPFVNAYPSYLPEAGYRVLLHLAHRPAGET